MKAQVLFGTNNVYTVLDQQGQHHSCRLKGKRLKGESNSQAPLVPGDEVLINVYEQGAGLIEERLPRTNVLRRQGKRVEQQVLAANIDQLVVIASLSKPLPKAELINRFLLLGQAAGVPTWLVFNKLDLLPIERAEFICHQWRREFRQAASGVEFISLHDDESSNWKQFQQQIYHRTTAVIGASGVGKSSLLNRLLGRQQQNTAAVSEAKSHHGVHTTTRATMVHGPNFCLIDTPGIRSLIPLIELEALQEHFPEFLPHLGQCQFSSCSHLHEPACAILQAVKFGAIPRARYQCYHRVFTALSSEPVYARKQH